MNSVNIKLYEKCFRYLIVLFKNATLVYLYSVAYLPGCIVTAYQGVSFPRQNSVMKSSECPCFYISSAQCSVWQIVCIIQQTLTKTHCFKGPDSEYF